MLFRTLLYAVAAVAAEPTWHKYVRSPPSNIVKPARILQSETKGNVTNADGLITGKAPTVFNRSSKDEEVPSVVVDFGQNVVGLLQVSFTGSKNITEGLPGLKLAFSETLQFLSYRSDYTRSDRASGDQKYTPGSDQVAVENKQYTWTDKIGCAYGRKVCADGLHGFRYVRVSFDAFDGDAPFVSGLGSISISGVSLEWSGYLGTPDSFTGWFECSDEDITQWWYDGVYTVDTNTDLFLANETEPRNAASPTLEGRQVIFDGAKRDRDPYVGDMAVASLTSYLSHDFAEASRNILEDLAWHQRSDGWIPPASIVDYTLPLFDYPLHWVICSVDYVLYTGNTSYADAYWTVLTKVLDGYYPQYIDSTTGLLTKSATLGYGDYAFLPRSGPITYYNALYVRALRYAAQLASSLGKDKSTIQTWKTRADSLAIAVNKHNFDDKVGAYFDGGACPGQPDGTYCDVHSQDGNSISILSGIANSVTAQKVLEYYGNATSRPYGNAFYDSSVLAPNDGFSDRVYAFISYFEIAARLATDGQQASAYDQIKRMYGWMAKQDPGITMWEGIGPNGDPYEGPDTSMSHGWSTGIVPLMSNYVLGVKPVTPGFQEWQICPVVEGPLTWARGVVPTPKGDISISWKKGNKFELSIKTPKGTHGKVCIPAGKAVVVHGNGSSSLSAGRTPRMINLSGGEYKILVTR